MADEAGKPNGVPPVQVEAEELFSIFKLPDGQIGFRSTLPPERILGTVLNVTEDLRYMALKNRLNAERRIQVASAMPGLKTPG
jgi:hypothetical protein